jgi:D-alanyl-D-alanine dipeptidase
MALSGSSWVNQFPTSRSVDDLQEPFRSSVGRFLKALTQGGTSLRIADTLRPPERAYLMHWSFAIANATANPAKVPLMSGVDIQWVHTDPTGHPDFAASKSAASDMVRGYGIVFAPALQSRHSEGLAIDITISWQGDLSIIDSTGAAETIRSEPRNGLNSDLHLIGASYGVIKLVTDPPHWSSDGH